MAKARAYLGSGRRPNLVGDRFGRLLVVEIGPMKGPRQTWRCVCDCGGETYGSTSDLRYGSVLSCGCLLKGETAANTRHNHSSRTTGSSKTYNSWRGMIDRCSNPSHKAYGNYGGRGISIHPDWRVFSNFLRDMGERPEGRSIDRIDVNGDYCPENCRWATHSEQARNRRPPRCAANDNAPNKEAAA